MLTGATWATDAPFRKTEIAIAIAIAAARARGMLVREVFRAFVPSDHEHFACLALVLQTHSG